MSALVAYTPESTLGSVIGQIERVETNTIVGWAYNSERPDAHVCVCLRVGNVELGSCNASDDRIDLLRAGFGKGDHGFRMPISVPFNSGENVQLELVDRSSGQSIAAIPFTVHCRDPRSTRVEELDAKSIHGQVPLRNSKQRKRVEAAVAPVLKPFRKLRKQLASKAKVSLPGGTTAKLARLKNLSIVDSANAKAWPSLSLPDSTVGSDRRSVSVIIPVHNQFQLTYQCLVSLILSNDKVDIDVIVVDDASTDLTGRIEDIVENLTVIRNDKNLGFLASCNKAAQAASGDYFVFLNNDTEVEPGWLDRMVEVFANFNSTGAVGAKLIYPDGRLQDAGGIVWESGTPWNVGHGQNRDDPEYNYVREVDYLTGAALMVSREAWDAVGGFDPVYSPAYYEDTDLAFKLRAAGFRTLYCPQACVIHYEGQSNGIDTRCGVKQYQVTNAETFKRHWQKQFVGHGCEGINLRKNKDRNRGLRVLVVDNAFPRLGQDAGSYAAVQEIKLLLSLGCKVTFLPNNLLHLGVHVDVLQKMGVECVHAPFHRSVPKFLERRAAEFDAVYVTRYVVAESIIPLVRQFSNAKIIFNNADLHFFREARTAWTDGLSDLTAVKHTRKRELAVMESADVVLSYSDVEIEIIASHLLTRDKLFRCPWVLDSQSLGKPYQQRQGLTFLGGYAHPPNKAAMDWFITHVMPELHKRRPDVTLHVWGSNMPRDSGWEDMPGVVLEGYAQSLDEVFTNALAFVGPLLAGAGIKGKVLDSVAYGVPTVLSPVAAEATGLINGSSTLIAQSPAQWISHIESLLDSEDLWQQLRLDSLALKDSRYSLNAGIESFTDVFDFLELDTAIVGQQVAGRKDL